MSRFVEKENILDINQQQINPKRILKCELPQEGKL